MTTPNFHANILAPKALVRLENAAWRPAGFQVSGAILACPGKFWQDLVSEGSQRLKEISAGC
jgi:hypothetical protein